MTKVAVVTDSTACIPPAFLKGLPIHVLPLQLIWDGTTLQDGIEITPTQFYERLSSSKTSPTTSQTPPALFEQKFRQLLDEGYEILTINISSKLSGTIDSAIQAKQAFPGSPIEIVDSLSTTMVMGFMAVAAARASNQGATLQECKTIAERFIAQNGLFFVVNTLEYLRRGGRIGGAAAFLGTALDLKPILELRNGRIESLEKVRTFNKSVDRMLDILEKRIGNRKPIQLVALHAGGPQEAETLMSRARERFAVSDVSEAVIAEISPVLGAHTGPGTMGFGFITGV